MESAPIRPEFAQDENEPDELDFEADPNWLEEDELSGDRKESNLQPTVQESDAARPWTFTSSFSGWILTNTLF